MFMKEGEIIDTGTHQKLMAGDNEYASLIKMYYTKEAEEEDTQTRPSNISYIFSWIVLSK